MKKIIIASAIVAVVNLAQASPLPDYPIVFARGEAEAEFKPDVCKVDFKITIRDKNPTNALQLIEQRSAEALAILADNGVKKKDVVGFEIDKDRVRNYEKRDQLEYLGYEMRRRIEFTLRDLTKYEPILSRLLKTPDVVDLDAAFDRSDRKDIESRLLAEAVSDARSKAELMAKGSGQRIVKLRAISQQGFYNLSEHFGLGNMEYSSTMYSRSAPSKRELLFVPSTIEFRNSVSLIYEIEEKK